MFTPEAGVFCWDNFGGLADEIILIAFGLILGTVAVTVILAFGLGGKDIAARQLDELIKGLIKSMGLFLFTKKRG